jgi:addiction module RelE/StbE family toxin
VASVTWTRDALNEVDAIGQFIGVEASVAARLFIQSIFLAVERLETFPRSGRVVPELGREDIRELLVGSYRLFYQVREDRVTILAVRHSSRLFRA